MKNYEAHSGQTTNNIQEKIPNTRIKDIVRCNGKEFNYVRRRTLPVQIEVSKDKEDSTRFINSLYRLKFEDIYIEDSNVYAQLVLNDTFITNHEIFETYQESYPLHADSPIKVLEWLQECCNRYNKEAEDDLIEIDNVMYNGKNRYAFVKEVDHPSQTNGYWMFELKWMINLRKPVKDAVIAFLHQVMFELKMNFFPLHDDYGIFDMYQQEVENEEVFATEDEFKIVMSYFKKGPPMQLCAQIRDCTEPVKYFRPRNMREELIQQWIVNGLQVIEIAKREGVNLWNYNEKNEMDNNEGLAFMDAFMFTWSVDSQFSFETIQENFQSQCENYGIEMFRDRMVMGEELKFKEFPTAFMQWIEETDHVIYYDNYV